MAAKCSDPLRDAGQTANCLLPVFQEFYDTVAPLFCGSAPQRADAGLPFDAAGGDASATSDARSDATAQSADASTDTLTDSQADSGEDAQSE